MRVGLTLVGGSDLTKHLADLPHAVSRPIQMAALKKGAEPIRDMAESLAPVDLSGGPPHLADNIVVAAASSRSLDAEGLFDAVAVEIGPRQSTFWGYFQEYGTVKQQASPFMRPAFDSQRSLSLQIVASELWAAIRRRVARVKR